MTPSNPSKSVRDTLTFELAPQCHRNEIIVLRVPFTAQDDGSTAYDRVESAYTCPLCQREYIIANVENQARIALKKFSVPLSTQYDDLRASLTSR